MLSPISTFQERFGPVRYLMAPMAGITDTVFRLLIREMGAQVVISELLSAEGISRRDNRTRDMLRFEEAERPVGIQIFGSTISSMVEAAKVVQEEGADFVDINFGCPVKKVVCDGGGAAWLREPQKLGELLTAIKAPLRIPLTIKVRTGWDESSRNVADVVQVAADCGVEWVAIHGRTRAQGYAGAADWNLIQQVAIKSRIPIVGNGDIVTAAQAKARIDNGFSHAVMIGRGALKNPWIFKELLSEMAPEKSFLSLIERHFEIALSKKESRRAFLSLKKFMGWYAAGYPYSSTFRSQIFQTHDVAELKKISLDFFASIEGMTQTLDQQPFLMGGHG